MDAVIDVLFEDFVSLWFAPSFKREFICELIESFVRELSVQMWSVNQRKTEAEEVTDSENRTKSVAVEEKTLVVQ
jgi:hypothetical protein